MRLDDWFLTIAERGNAATAIDRRRDDGAAWTEGNRVEVLVDGATYFHQLGAVLEQLMQNDLLLLTDWEGDGDERIDGHGCEVGSVLARASTRGAQVRGLLWRSHPRQAHFAEQSNAALAQRVNAVGGEVLLDERVRRGGSHHQKLIVIERHSRGAVAFVGGIDLAHGRNDDSRHLGDDQPVALDRRYGPHPPWHDVQLCVRGPAVGDLAFTFRERWDDPTPLDHRNPWRRLARRLTREPRHPRPLPPPLVPATEPGATPGTHAVQVLRTYPAKRPPYPFAPAGERSIARAYLKAFKRAERLVYIEDQYLWSVHAAHALAAALRAHPELHVIVVVPRDPDRAGRVSSAAARLARERVTSILRAAGGDRLAIYDIENDLGTPIYVHAKVCIIDDVLMIVGSDNLNRRSWTHDSEVSCAVIDTAGQLARATRLQLWREHLGLGNGDDDDDILEPERGFAAFARHAAALDAWHAEGCVGARPSGRVRHHLPERVAAWARGPALVAAQVVFDPDGRPLDLRRARTM
jgi:phosphatidylserine/phosphatidylglycerophosphate/cardiolipin synthase-like enzyme